MPKPIFQFRLRKDPTTYYYVDGGEVVTSATAVNLLESLPDWDKLQKQWRRSATYHGVLRAYSPEATRFCKDAAQILRYLYNTQGGTEAVCELEVYRLNSTDQLYYPRWKCTVNFGRYNNTETIVSTALIEGGLAALLRAYDTTDRVIPIGEPGGDPDSDWIWLSGFPGGGEGGVMLLGNYHYQTQAGTGSVTNSIAVVSGTESNSLLGTVFIEKEGAYAVLMPRSVIANGVAGVGLIENGSIATTISIFQGTITGTVQLDQIINLPGSGQDMRLEIRVITYNPGWGGTATSTTIWSDPGGNISPGGSRINVSATFTAVPITYADGDYITLQLVGITPLTTSGGTSCNMQVYINETPTDIDLAFQFRQEDSPARCLSHWQVFRKLFHQLTGQTAIDPISDLLTTDVYPGPEVYNLNPKNTFFTSGDALRQLYLKPDGTVTDPSIKTTIKEFNDDALFSLGAGLGIELDGAGNEVLRCEKLEHFYQKDLLIADLGVVTKLQVYPYDEYKGNNMKAGYKDKTFEEVNGRFDYNSESSYQTSVTSIIKDVDFKMPYSTSPYDTEYTRANLANKKTTDDSSDNQTFKVQSNGNRLPIGGLATDAWEVDKAQTVFAGLPADVWPTLFNMPFSPARCIGRCLSWLKSIYGGITNPVLTYKKSAKNGDVVSSMYTGPVVTEAANVDLTPDGSGNDVIYIPTVLDFECPVPLDIDPLMETRKYGVFRFIERRKNTDYTIEGFVLEAGVTDGTNETYNFKLLLSPKTPLPKYF